jgi:hypothetical protein
MELFPTIPGASLPPLVADKESFHVFANADLSSHRQVNLPQPRMPIPFEARVLKKPRAQFQKLQDSRPW